MGALADLTVRNFKCWPKFIIDFRKRWNMALRRPNLKRRPKATPEQIETFRETVKRMIRKHGARQVINMDETNYRLVNNSHLTWFIKGEKTVTCHIDNDTKEGVTVIASITARQGEGSMLFNHGHICSTHNREREGKGKSLGY